MAGSTSQETKINTRKIAVKLLGEGWSQSKVAKFLQVSQSSVSNWKRAYESKGLAGLKSAPISGRPSRLDKAQKQALKAYLNQGAEAAGFTGNFWTQKRVSRLISEQFSVEIKPRQCGNILKELGYVLKLPQTKSYEQDLEKVEEWKTERIAEIKKKQKSEMP